MISDTPKTPYYAVIFSSIKTDFYDAEYNTMSNRMIVLAKKQDGFLGIETARETLGITVSYWTNLEAIKMWRENVEHSEAREKGRNLWYEKFKVRICKVEKDYLFVR